MIIFLTLRHSDKVPSQNLFVIFFTDRQLLLADEVRREWFIVANSDNREADFPNETVAQPEISFEFGCINGIQLDLIEKKGESINRMLWKLSKSLEKSEDR